MSDVTILFRDGTRREFRDPNPPGSQHWTWVDYRPGFVLVMEYDGGITSFPADLVKSVLTKSCRTW